MTTASGQRTAERSGAIRVEVPRLSRPPVGVAHDRKDGLRRAPFSKGALKALLICGDLVATAVSLELLQVVWGTSLPAPLGAFSAVSASMVLGLFLAEGYDSPSLGRGGGLPTRLLIATAISAIAVGVVSFAFPQLGLVRRTVASLYAVLFPIILLWRLGGAGALRRALPPRRVAVVGSGEAARDLISAFEENDEYTLASVIATGEDALVVSQSERRVIHAEYSDLPSRLVGEGIDLVAVAVPGRDPGHLRHYLVECRYHGIEVQDVANCFELLTQRLPVRYLNDGWVAYSSRFVGWDRDFEKKIKRLLDISVAFLVLVACAPLLLVLALAIRVTSAGPVLFRQERVGRGGSVYTLFKFRSMRTDAEENGVVWAAKNDQRVTPIGGFLRERHLDELPQLWNVLKGEMSLVGPRPERPEFVQELREVIPYYDLRHVVKPGVTGWAQICYPYGASVKDAETKLEYDLYYVRHKSLLWDLRIILRTITVSVLGRGSR